MRKKAEHIRIMAVSDEVLNRVYNDKVAKRYPDVDLLIGCGDLPYYYLDFLCSGMDLPMVYVLGNHDRGPQYTVDRHVLTKVQGGRNIHGRVVNEKGLLIGGLEGSMRYRPNAPLMYTEHEMWTQIARMIPRLVWNRLRHGRALDILVTHAPVSGIHDKKDLAHRGFKVFRWFLKTFKPRYMLHGHVHIYQGAVRPITRFHETEIINVYPLFQFDLNPAKKRVNGLG